jgi:hypothetical protein
MPAVMARKLASGVMVVSQEKAGQRDLSMPERGRYA